jgi:hypothetical protein
VELITPHRTTNYHENRKGGQGPVWAVAPLIIIIIIITTFLPSSLCFSSAFIPFFLHLSLSYFFGLLFSFVVSSIFPFIFSSFLFLSFLYFSISFLPFFLYFTFLFVLLLPLFHPSFLSALLLPAFSFTNFPVFIYFFTCKTILLQ